MNEYCHEIMFFSSKCFSSLTIWGITPFTEPNPAQLELFTATPLLTDCSNSLAFAQSDAGLKHFQTPTNSRVVSQLIKPPGGRNIESSEVTQISSSHHAPLGSVTSTPLITPRPPSCVWAQSVCTEAVQEMNTK